VPQQCCAMCQRSARLWGSSKRQRAQSRLTPLWVLLGVIGRRVGSRQRHEVFRSLSAGRGRKRGTGARAPTLTPGSTVGGPTPPPFSNFMDSTAGDDGAQRDTLENASPWL